MSSLSRPVLSLVLALTLGGGCTFNVRALDEEVLSETTEPLARLTADFEATGVPVDGDIVIRGADRTGAAATIQLAGLIGGGDDPDEIARGLDVSWPTDADLVTDLRIAHRGPLAESVWIEGLAIELPIGTDLEANAGAASLDVEGLEGDLMLTTGSGSMHVRDADEVVLEAGSGSIDVVAQSGHVETGSGSIVFTGPLVAIAGSGSIAGSFGGHAEANAGSGSIDLELTTELDGDVTLGAGSGSVVLTIPRGAAMNLELGAGSGSVHVETTDVSFDGESWAGAINGGGPFTVRIETGSGSVTVRERL